MHSVILDKECVSGQHVAGIVIFVIIIETPTTTLITLNTSAPLRSIQKNGGK